MTNTEVSNVTPAPAKKPTAKKPAKVKKAKAAPKAKVKAKAKATKYEPREGTKVAKLIAAMKTPKGIATDEAAKAFKWETKSIRGVISGTLRAKMGLTIVTVNDEKRGNVYRIK